MLPTGSHCLTVIVTQGRHNKKQYIRLSFNYWQYFTTKKCNKKQYYGNVFVSMGKTTWEAFLLF
jgi:hypothetical protein